MTAKKLHDMMRHDICEGIDELTPKQQEQLFLRMAFLVGRNRFQSAPDGCRIDLDKLSDFDVAILYGAFKKMEAENAPDLAHFDIGTPADECKKKG